MCAHIGFAALANVGPSHTVVLLVKNRICCLILVVADADQISLSVEVRLKKAGQVETS